MSSASRAAGRERVPPKGNGERIERDRDRWAGTHERVALSAAVPGAAAGPGRGTLATAELLSAFRKPAMDAGVAPGSALVKAAGSLPGRA